MRTRWISAALTTCFVVLAISSSDAIAQQSFFRVAGEATKKLSPELAALLHAGSGDLVGVTDNQVAVISAEGRAEAKAVQSGDGARKISGKPEFSPVTQLVVNYGNGKRPTEAALKKVGFRSVVHSEDGHFVVVEPVGGKKRGKALAAANGRGGAGISAKAVSALVDIKGVSSIESNYTIKLIPNELEGIRIKNVPKATSNSPNDPLLDRLYGMSNINADPTAWDVINKSPNVVVAVIDTGVDYDHEDLAANMWRNPGEKQNGKDDDGNGIPDDIHGASFLVSSQRLVVSGDPDDDQGHGTHCAGTVAAVGDNGTGVVGVTWKAQIMALKFLDRSGSGSSVGAVRCIDYAINKGADIISTSWGGGQRAREIEAAIARAEDAGILFVAAAGNENRDIDSQPSFPAAYDIDNIISVAAIDEDDERADFSNTGRVNVDIGAPGVAIGSTYPNDRYVLLNGTSMATPHVSGAAALVWASQGKSASAVTVRNWLLSKARPVGRLAQFWKGDADNDGGVLDVSSLADTTEGPKPGTGGAIVAGFDQFSPGDFDCLDESKVIGKVTLDLDEECDVFIAADSSARAVRSLTQFTTGFYLDADSGLMWADSMRGVDLTAKRWSSFSSSVVVRLPKGSHTIFWKVHVRRGCASLDGGAMRVTAHAASPTKKKRTNKVGRRR